MPTLPRRAGVLALLAALVAMVAMVALPWPAWARIDIEKVTSPGGMTAWLVREPAIPFVTINIAFKGGSNLDTPQTRGATNLMTALLEEGAGDRDARAFTERQETLATRFSFDTSKNSVRVTARFLTENRAASVALLRDALVRPRFDEAAVDRVRRQVLTAIEAGAKDQGRIAANTLAARAFAGHPQAASALGSVETVQRLTRADLIVAHRRALTRDRVFVTIVGDITPEGAKPMLDTLLGALPAAGPPPPPVSYTLHGGLRVVDFPDAPQSVVRFSQPGLDITDKDFLKLMVLNHIVGGGGGNARLYSEVRERRGLTYAIDTYLISEPAPRWIGNFSSSNGVVGTAIEAIRTVWADLARNGPTDREVADAIAYLTGAYPLRFDGNARIAGILTGMQMQGIPIEYPTTRNAQVRAITPEDVRQIARQVMDPEALYFVVVGQPEDVAPQP